MLDPKKINKRAIYMLHNIGNLGKFIANFTTNRINYTISSVEEDSFHFSLLFLTQQ